MRARYEVNPESLRFHCPPGTRAPSIVDDFYDWLSIYESGSLGHFALTGDRLDDFYVEDGSRAAPAFVSFLVGGAGGRVGWWRPQGEPLDEAPVVLLGSEGELRALAGTAGDFLLK